MRKHEELLAAYDRLREHDRLKSAFVANMSHELRTPLNVIIGLCQLLSRDPAAAARAVPVATPSGGWSATRARCSRLVNDMLDYSRLEAGRSALHLELVEAGEVIEYVTRGFEAEAREKKIELRVEVSPEVGVVSTDRQKLTQVMTCLVSNAVKFTSAGSVAVTAGAEGARAAGILRSATPASAFRATRWPTSSTASGRWTTGSTRSYSGVGLGLAITRRIVELLDGEIKVESRQNEGSRFRITWPRESQPRTGTGSLVAPRTQTEGSLPRRLRAV